MSSSTEQYWLICYVEERRSQTSIESYFVNDVHKGLLSGWNSHMNKAHKEAHEGHKTTGRHVLVSATPITEEDYLQFVQQQDEGMLDGVINIRSLQI